jgi:hypothetical protein
VTSTPGQSLGNEDTELGDLQLIFKSRIYENCGFTLSGGLSVSVPTARDERVNVTDFTGDPRLQFPDTERIRSFHIKNENWGLTPFFAFLEKPTDRFFIQGFIEADFPTNGDAVVFSETSNPAPNFPSFFNPSLPGTPNQLLPNPESTGNFSRTVGADNVIRASQAAGLLPSTSSPAIQPIAPGSLRPPYTVERRYFDQALGELDLNTGYWVIRNPQSAWLTGLAPTLELHYTVTLNKAHPVTLPGDGNYVEIAQGPQSGNFLFGTETPPRVGPSQNYTNILDATLGTTFEFGNRATLSTGLALPLLDKNNRTFDWELLVQFNVYFGRTGAPPAPATF